MQWIEQWSPLTLSVNDRRLIVMDINGVLTDRGPYYKRLAENPVKQRPHMRQFLEFLSANFDIIIWSAGTVDVETKKLLQPYNIVVSSRNFELNALSMTLYV